MTDDTCRRLLRKACSMINEDKPVAEVHAVFEKNKDLVMNETRNLSPDELYWFSSKCSDNCYDLGMYQEAELFLRMAIRIALDKQDYDELGYSVSRLMAIMIIDKRYSETIAIGEKYEIICSGSDWVYEIETGLCLVYPARGWNRKAQRLANIVIEHKKKNPDAYYHPVTCSLYKRSYNSGKCRNKIRLLSEWYDLECHVNGSNSPTAMEVLAEKARLVASEGGNGALEAISLLDEAIPILEKSGCEYSVVNLPLLIVFHEQLKVSVCEGSSTQEGNG